MKMTNGSKPKLAQLFEDMLWVNTPKDWAVTSVYTKRTLFVSMLIGVPYKEQCETIRRSFAINVINNRSSDLWGLAADCVDEMKRELKARRNI
jgi:hypothetical protein